MNIEAVKKDLGLWEIRSYETENILLHADRIPGEIAWAGEKLAYLARLVEDLENAIENAEGKAFLRAKGVELTRVRITKGGRREETFTASDDVAKFIMRTDPTVVDLKQTLSRVREVWARMKGYEKALDKKSVLVSGMVGIARDELRTQNQRGGY
jgi:methylthioribose-1-phosphate isomerase